jgi:hypothetical protein
MYMVMENSFSSREAVSPIKVIIWNKEFLMGVEFEVLMAVTMENTVF